MAARVTGVDQMRRRLQTLARRMPDVVGRALYQEAEIEATEAKRRTPVDTGALRGTIHVTPPTHSRSGISVTIAAGGPAAPYAAAVHEDLEAFHKVGQAKYIESVLNESGPYMASRIARRIDLKRAL